MPLAQLVERPGEHDGRAVVTEGVVQSFDEPLHHWVEDGSQHRVEVIPRQQVAPHVGDRVRVEGRFTAAGGDRGRHIEVERLEVLEEAVVEPA